MILIPSINLRKVVHNITFVNFFSRQAVIKSFSMLHHKDSVSEV
jgi:hypothetical protein